ncbi:MAG: hypothetical protein MUQ10_18155 [Anaerolineae bacterium]|nr:hypothetical protein [Anaerolineae bacterium]
MTTFPKVRDRADRGRADVGCIIRAKSIGDSDGFCPSVPGYADHLSGGMASIFSGAPELVDDFIGIRSRAFSH